MSFKHMIYSNTPTIPGREITEVLGVVTGNVVQSKHVGRDIMAAFKGVVGGEIKSYTDMLTEARHIAISRMVQAALELDADAVVGLRFTTSSIMSNASEILAYGTAVKLRD
ncbi:MAG: heavy metal-binding domain-containing protein [Pyrinomonadaceae bacterium]